MIPPDRRREIATSAALRHWCRVERYASRFAPGEAMLLSGDGVARLGLDPNAGTPVPPGTPVPDDDDLDFEVVSARSAVDLARRVVAKSESSLKVLLAIVREFLLVIIAMSKVLVPTWRPSLDDAVPTSPPLEFLAETLSPRAC